MIDPKARADLQKDVVDFFRVAMSGETDQEIANAVRGLKARLKEKNIELKDVFFDKPVWLDISDDRLQDAELMIIPLLSGKIRLKDKELDMVLSFKRGLQQRKFSEKQYTTLGAIHSRYIKDPTESHAKDAIRYASKTHSR